MRGEGEPLPPGRVVQGCEAGAVLVVAAGELDVIEDHPDVGRVQLGQGGQAREKVRLVDRTQPFRMRGPGYRRVRC